MPRRSHIATKKRGKQNPQQQNIPTTGGPPVSPAANPPSPPPSPRWWEGANHHLRVVSFTGDGAEIEAAEHVQVVENGTGIIEGTVAVVHLLRKQPEKCAIQVAQAIAANPKLLDDLTDDKGVIDRRGSRPDPYAEDPLEDWATVARLAACAEVNCDEDDPIRSHLELALEYQFEGPEHPDIENLRQARDEFLALPKARQRRILNGWEPEGERLTRREIMEHVETGAIWPKLTLHSHQRELWASREYELDPSAAKVCVQISLGCTFAEALRTVEAVAALIKARWEKLIQIRSVEVFGPNHRIRQSGEDTYES
jgi:hypothetical protein